MPEKETVTVARFSVYGRRGVETVFAAGAFERPGLSNTSTTLEEYSRPDETDPPTKNWEILRSDNRGFWLQSPETNDG
jgi:hypothetical protein